MANYKGGVTAGDFLNLTFGYSFIIKRHQKQKHTRDRLMLLCRRLKQSKCLLKRILQSVVGGASRIRSRWRG